MLLFILKNNSCLEYLHHYLATHIFFTHFEKLKLHT